MLSIYIYKTFVSLLSGHASYNTVGSSELLKIKRKAWKTIRSKVKNIGSIYVDDHIVQILSAYLS